MEKIIIVGSGASGVHFALSVLKKGYEVVMLDVGYTGSNPVNPEDRFNDLKTNLHDPIQYFLGKNFEAVIYPDDDSEYYGFPPGKNYVFKTPDPFSYKAKGFEPLFSFAQGGLASAWTGGSYPFNDAELKDFPFTYNEIEPFYSEVADRIGIMGEPDDTARFFPFHKNLLPPFSLDYHSNQLLSEYEKHKHALNTRLNCYMGRTRVASLSCDKGDRKKCACHGRCLWGCPQESIYTPSVTLKQCFAYSNFTYIPNMYVNHFTLNKKQKVTGVTAESLQNKKTHRFTCDKLVLAAGTLCSSKIFLDSLYMHEGVNIKLPGLMDNRQVLVPFINLKMIGKPYNPESYQYHQIAISFEGKNPKDFIHGQLTTLKTALIHPIIQSLPVDLKTGISIFKNIHCALGVVNVNFNDTRREGNSVTLDIDKKMMTTALAISYSSQYNESLMIKKGLHRVKKALFRLGCIAPNVMTHLRPMGASVHYSGTIPMSDKKVSLTSSPYCQSHDFDNLYIVDGTTFPFLPAKNLTFTLMANAVRIADTAF